MLILSTLFAGCPLGTPNCIIKAGTNQFVNEGKNRSKNSKNVTLPFCHTIKVVMSPKGEKAPPALAATTIETQLTATKAGEARPTANTTAPKTKAVVKLSRTPERKNAKIPDIQNSCRYDNPRSTNLIRRTSNTRRSSNVFTYVMATSRNKKSSPYSKIICCAAASASGPCPDIA